MALPKTGTEQTELRRWFFPCLRDLFALASIHWLDPKSLGSLEGIQGVIDSGQWEWILLGHTVELAEVYTKMSTPVLFSIPKQLASPRDHGQVQLHAAPAFYPKAHALLMTAPRQLSWWLLDWCCLLCINSVLHFVSPPNFTIDRHYVFIFM